MNFECSVKAGFIEKIEKENCIRLKQSL